MSRMNDGIRLGVMAVNSLLFLLGIGLVAAAAYVLSTDWGELEPSFYTGWVTGFVVIGVLLFLSSMLGCCGVIHQVKREGTLTGRRVLGGYQLTLVALCISTLYLAVSIDETADSLNHALEVEKGDSGRHLEYDGFERDLAGNFNEFWFAGASSCTSKYNWFFRWIKNNCKDDSEGSLDEDSCCEETEKKDSYCGISDCPCAGNCTRDGDEDNFACPYPRCRKGALKFLVSGLSPIAEYSFFVAGLICLTIVLNCLLICYNPRDDFKKMLVKTGAYDAEMFGQARSQRVRKRG